MSSKLGCSTTTGPLADTCPECLSKAWPGDAKAEATGPGEEGDTGPSNGVLGPCMGDNCCVGGGVPPAHPDEGATAAEGCLVDAGSNGMFSMFSTSMSSSSVSGGLLSSLWKKLNSLKGGSSSSLMLLMISRKDGRILGLYCQHILISSNLQVMYKWFER